MPKKVIISDKEFKDVILKEEFDKDDVIDVLKRDKEAEKQIKSIVADVIGDLFRVLWQRKSTYENELKR